MDKPEKFITDGIRLDGRKPNELRPIKIEVGILNRADGSCYLEFGKNKVIAAVYGPREVHPRHMQKPTTAVVRFRYNMASFSVEERKRPGPDRRSIEVSKVSREAVEPMIFTEYFPKSAIDIFVEVLQADAGTRTAGINAASVALADAGIPMRGLVSACAVGKVDGELVLDLMKEEDNYGEADMPLAMAPNGEITLLQMDGNFTKEEFKKALEMAKDGCRQIYELQRNALIERYNKDMEAHREEVELAEAIVESEAEKTIIPSTEEPVTEESLIEESEEIISESTEEVETTNESTVENSPEEVETTEDRESTKIEETKISTADNLDEAGEVLSNE
jgi:exosome complex component RRP41